MSTEQEGEATPWGCLPEPGRGLPHCACPWGARQDPHGWQAPFWPRQTPQPQAAKELKSKCCREVGCRRLPTPAPSCSPQQGVLWPAPQPETSGEGSQHTSGCWYFQKAISPSSLQEASSPGSLGFQATQLTSCECARGTWAVRLKVGCCGVDEELSSKTRMASSPQAVASAPVRWHLQGGSAGGQPCSPQNQREPRGAGPRRHAPRHVVDGPAVVARQVADALPGGVGAAARHPWAAGGKTQHRG